MSSVINVITDLLNNPQIDHPFNEVAAAKVCHLFLTPFHLA